MKTKSLIDPEVYYIISKEFDGSINAIYRRFNGWYEVSYGPNNLAAYFLIVNGRIVDTQFD